MVLIHGYPLSGRAWDKQVPVLLEAGHRVITYDRRGFGNSSRPSTGYDFDTFASDLKALLDEVDLHDVTLVGHSSPDGLAASLFEGFAEQAKADTPAFMKGFLDDFYNMDQYAGKLVSPEAFASSLDLALAASAIAAVACVPTWETDFRDDLPKIDIPLLVIQGDADRILPFEKTGQRLPELVDCELVAVEGGPHAISWTHADQVNDALLQFVGAAVPA